MREILFRGKRKDTGEWVEGHLHKMDGYGTGYTEYGIQVQVISTSRPWSVLVLPETVGQYIGLTANGKKIFEGDIVKMLYKDDIAEIGPIMWSDVGLRYKFASSDGTSYSFDCTATLEVIGNIHDNPELLKED